MTDLRTRIAKILHQRFGPSLGAHPSGWDREPYGTQDMYLADADAVIATLGLRQEWGLLDDDDNGTIYDTREGAQTPLPGESLKTRHVTEWQPDE